MVALLIGLLGYPAKTWAQNPGDDALVAAYGFNEGSGTTTADLTGNQLTGTFTGATWNASGRFGAAASFDGNGDWVTVNASPLLNFTTGMSCEAWVYPTALSSWRTVALRERAGGGLSYALYAHTPSPARPATLINTGGSDVEARGTAQLALNTWTHLATTYNGSQLRLYVNGALVQTQAVSGSIVTSADPLRFGGNSIWGEYFTGRIDEVRIHSRALTQTEIQSLMTIPVAANPGFEIIVYNGSVELGLSDSEIFNLGIAPSGGFTNGVTPSVTGLPPGAVAVFEPADGPPHPGPFALTVFTGPSTPAGSYPLEVTCTNGALSDTANLTMVVNSAPGFRVSAEPNALLIAQGRNGSASVRVKAENGYVQAVNLQATGLPAGVSASFLPSSLVPTNTSTVLFQVSVAATPGVYPVTLSATNGPLAKQATFTLTVLPQNPEGAWRQVAMGDAPAMFYGVIEGEVGGIRRVIGSAGDGIMYEYLYNGSTWSFTQMPVGVFADGEMHNMAIGPARRDGVNRLYIAAAGSGRVYELSWVNGAWQTNVVATLNGSTDIIIGNGRNDGVLRMYVTWMSGTTEFTWNGSGWTQLTMSSNEGGWVHGCDLFAGRNDGINRIYTANQGNGQVNEYSWNGTAWIKLLMGNTGDARNIEVGDVRNDGVARAYVPAGNGNVYEFTWSGAAWQMVSIGNAGTSTVKVQGIPVKARSDNFTRLYVSAGAGVYEYQWTGSAWQTAHLGDAVAYMYGLAAGDGLNNGKIQVYGSSYDGNVYMFEWLAAEVAVPNVVGLTQSAAIINLTNADLTIGTITQAPSNTVPNGSVISQTPIAGTQAPAGSSVNLVISTGPSSPYAAWASANGLTEGVNDGPYEDPDLDGIRNALEFLLGGAPLTPAPAIAPISTVGIADFLFTFKRADASEAETTQTVQWGNDLGIWVDVPIGASSSNASFGVVVTITENGSATDDVTVAVPHGNAIGGKLFVRLIATKP